MAIRVAKLKLLIETTLEHFFIDESKSAQSVHPTGGGLVKAISEFTLRKGAKRTRGILVLLGFMCRGKKITKDILKIAAAYEILQSYLLIHDDIIDSDSERRGKPTLHKLFQSYVPVTAKTIREKTGIDIAIIAGDVASELVQRLVLLTTYTASKKIQILTHLNRTLYTTYVGQVLDIIAIPEKIPDMQSQWLRYEQKTAIYTIEAPFILGAQIAKAKIDEKKFHTFAIKTGVAFQLADDVQNIFGQGMSARQSDVREGKITLLISLALLSPDHSSHILTLLKKKPKSSLLIQKLKRQISESGGYDRAIAHIEKGFAEGVSLMPDLRISKSVQQALTSLLESLQQTVKHANV